MSFKKNNLYFFFYGCLFCLLSIFIIQQALFLGLNRTSLSNSNKSHDQLSFQKIEEMYNLILSTYYEPVDTTRILNSMLESILESVDPHTSYFSAIEHNRENEEMMGNFYGIGIQFSIFQDTIVVIRVLPNGPSEKTELMAGDRITHVDGEKITGPTISNEEVLNRLRGKKGSKVQLTVFSQDKEKNIELYRDEIPLNSIASSYIIDNDIAYLKIDKFSATTYSEFINHINSLVANGAEKMIIDLRGNTGGYLDQSVAIADELLDFGLDIVSVKGDFRDEVRYKSTYQGQLSNYPLIILIDEFSASASEILAGAIQDNNRGEIVGRTSFGKGLVGEEFSLGDGSVLRMTVAKYFTPSGRCIQKDISNYYDLINDSVSANIDQYHNKIDSTKIFYTSDGDTVFGGGGIHPDYYIEDEKMKEESIDFINDNFSKLDELSFQFIDSKRSNLKDEADHFRGFLNSNMHIFWAMFLDSIMGDELNKKMYNSQEMNYMKIDVQQQLEILLARNFLSTQEFIYFVNEGDQILNKAVKLLKYEDYEF
tara:strand:+ start:318 stop:1934 length:1617 start_codon:yes stop_codon:yes gene_type:complete